jgi:hypothetical protein
MRVLIFADETGLLKSAIKFQEEVASHPQCLVRMAFEYGRDQVAQNFFSLKKTRYPYQGPAGRA